MKSTCLFLGLLFATSLLAQERVSYQQPLEYKYNGEVFLKEVLSFPGKSKSELFQIAEEWFARKFTGEPIQFETYSDDPNKLIGRGFFGYQLYILLSESYGEVSYILTISVKDERIKVEMEEIFIIGPTSVITVDEEYPQPKPAHEVIGDDALYKRNGKVRKVKRKHKEKILEYWNKTLLNIEEFFNASHEEEDW